jgi:hypothetical protein
VKSFMPRYTANFQKTLNEKKFSPNVSCEVIVGETP